MRFAFDVAGQPAEVEVEMSGRERLRVGGAVVFEQIHARFSTAWVKEHAGHTIGFRARTLPWPMAEVEVGSLLAVVHVLHADQVHVMFRARLVYPEFGAGPESLEVMLCDEAAVPWDQIAFRSVDFALRRYFDDRRRGVEDHHFTALDYRKPAG